MYPCELDELLLICLFYTSRVQKKTSLLVFLFIEGSVESYHSPLLLFGISVFIKKNLKHPPAEVDLGGENIVLPSLVSFHLRDAFYIQSW